MIKSKHLGACFFVELIYINSMFYDINSEVDSYLPHTKRVLQVLKTSQPLLILYRKTAEKSIKLIKKNQELSR